MIDFLLNNYTLITHSLEFLAAITGLIFFKKFKNSHVRYFIYFLVFIAISDTLCFYTYFVKPNMSLSFLIGTKLEKSHWWANLYWVIGAIMFFTFYYYNILKIKSFKKFIKLSSYSFFVFSIIFIIINWESFFNSFFFELDIFGAVVIFLCVVLYFIEILQSDNILEFYKSINFYISVAIFIWWLIIPPMTFYDVYFKYEIGIGHIDRDFFLLRRKIFLFANIFMYLTYTFAFIWCKPENEL